MRLSTWVTRRKKYKPEKNIKSDPQRYNVYYVESITGGVDHRHYADNIYLKKIAAYACRLYRLKPPTVCVFLDKGNKRCGWCEGDKIYLNKGHDGANIRTLLHELAHYIVIETYADCEDDPIYDHGPEFAAVYGFLLDRFNVMPRECWDLLCKEYNVVQAHDGSPEAVRHEQKVYRSTKP